VTRDIILLISEYFLDIIALIPVLNIHKMFAVELHTTLSCRWTSYNHKTSYNLKEAEIHNFIMEHIYINRLMILFQDKTKMHFHNIWNLGVIAVFLCTCHYN